MTSDALGDHDATGLLQELAAGRVSRAELVEAAIHRAEAVDPQLNAVARWIDRPEGRHDPDAPFAGLPSFLKDNEDLAGVPTTHGSLAVSPRPQPRSTAITTQFEALGFTFVGKSTLPEFGLTASTESTACGATRNPWDLTRSPGASSGGAGALVAAGVVPIAHGNDGGGSVRIPAACCGLVGLKPTNDRLVPVEAMAHLPVKLATQGVLTRSVRDTALFYSAAEQHYANPWLPPLGHVRGPSRRRLRIAAYDQTFRGMRADADNQRAVRETAEWCESLGHTVDWIDNPFPERVGQDFLKYWELLAGGLARMGRQLFGHDFDAGLLTSFTIGLGLGVRGSIERMPVSIGRLRRFRKTFDDRFAIGATSYDVFLSPVVGHVTPPIGYLGPDVPFRTHLLRLLRYTTFTPLHNVAGAPAISLPLSRTAGGLPIGLQFAARIGDDRTLLELAYELEAARPWPLVAPLAAA